MEKRKLSEVELNKNIIIEVKSNGNGNQIDEEPEKNTDNGEDIVTPYEDPTMILTKSRVTIGLLGLVIVTLSTMMIFVILSVRIDSRIVDTEPHYVISKTNSEITFMTQNYFQFLTLPLLV